MSRFDLKKGEPHPMAASALVWIRQNYDIQELLIQQEAFSTCSIEGNRIAEICGETLRRLFNNEPVSDRYLLGLAWCLRKTKDDIQEK